LMIPIVTHHGRLQRAQEALSKPPVPSDVERPEPHGALVARYVLPLRSCPTTNRTRHADRWRHAHMKQNILSLLLCQCYAQGQRPRTTSLGGRPQVLCVRFSSVEPDPRSDWAKMVVDKLTVKHGGLGYFRDDTRRALEQHQWWEQARKGDGFVYVEIREGKADTRATAGR
jgi:hypothetical protein